MTRWASGLNAAAAGKQVVALVTLCQLQFDSGTLYVHDGYAQLSFGGNTYSGIGDYGSVDVVEESTETIARTLALKLTGIPGTALTDAMTTDYQGRGVVLFIGLLDVNNMTWIDTPEEIWAGRMDFMTITIEQGKTSIELRCENRLNREPLVSRYTDVDQQLAYPGDTFFDLVWMIPQSQAGWGGVTVQYPANIPPTGRGMSAGNQGSGGGMRFKTPG